MDLSIGFITGSVMEAALYDMIMKQVKAIINMLQSGRKLSFYFLPEKNSFLAQTSQSLLNLKTDYSRHVQSLTNKV
jgi:hypothetical protein